jgi:hypothetical protein
LGFRIRVEIKDIDKQESQKEIQKEVTEIERRGRSQ